MDNVLFKIEQVIADGQSLAIEDGTGSLEGAAGFSNETVPSATGDDFVRRKRIARTMKCKIQFGDNVDPAALARMHNVQVTARDTSSGRRALMPKCTFGEMGAIGGGSVDLTFNVLSPIQWL